MIGGEVVEWLPAQGPHLKEHHPKTPHITACAVLAVEDGLGGGPLDGDLPPSRHIVSLVCEVSGHPKVSNLWWEGKRGWHGWKASVRKEGGGMKGG